MAKKNKRISGDNPKKVAVPKSGSVSNGELSKGYRPLGGKLNYCEDVQGKK